MHALKRRIVICLCETLVGDAITVTDMAGTQVAEAGNMNVFAAWKITEHAVKAQTLRVTYNPPCSHYAGFAARCAASSIVLPFRWVLP